MKGRLVVDGLSVQFGGLTAVDHVGLAVDGARIVGLIGPNGAGKTTFIDAVGGFVPATGRVELDGVRIDAMAPHERARRGLVRTFQSLELFDDLSVRENLLVAAEQPSWWGPLVDAVRPAVRRPADVDWALGAVGLDGAGDRAPAELSNGARHLLALARAVAGRARLLLLDEPAAGLDTNETVTLGRRLRDLAALGIGILLVDHDMSLVLDVCDTVHVIDFGKIIASGSPAEVRMDASVVAAYLGTAASETGPTT